MRRAARVDANHEAVVSALRAAGASVQSLAPIGKGCPDLLVGKGPCLWLIEVKDGQKPPSARQLTPDQKQWMQTWRGPMPTIAYGPEDALRLIGAIA